MTTDQNGRLRLPLLLDGATGTEYMKAGLPSGVCVEQWAAEHPDVVARVARGYADYTKSIPVYRAAKLRLLEAAQNAKNNG